MTAAAIATLDELTGGRVFLGLGGGSLALDPLLIQRKSPAAAIRETIEASRALWRGDRVDVDGSFVKLRRAVLDYGSPRIPIWVAGRGLRVLTVGGGFADGVTLDHIHKDFLPGEAQHVRDAARAAGNDVALAYATTIVTTDDDLERARRNMTYRLVDSPPAVREVIGLSEAGAHAIRVALAEGLDAAATLVRDEWVFPFVIHGTPRECAASLAELGRNCGFAELIVPTPDMGVAAETLAAAATVLELMDRERLSET